MTSSTQREVQNVFNCRQRRTESLPRVTCTEKFVKFVRVVFEICARTDRQTDTLIAVPRTRPGADVTRNFTVVGLNERVKTSSFVQFVAATKAAAVRDDHVKAILISDV